MILLDNDVLVDIEKDVSILNRQKNMVRKKIDRVADELISLREAEVGLRRNIVKIVKKEPDIELKRQELEESLDIVSHKLSKLEIVRDELRSIWS